MSTLETSEGVFTTQTSYIEKLLARFNMEDCKLKKVPLSVSENFKRLEYPNKGYVRNDYPSRERVGCLLYLCVCRRPDIALVITELS